MNKKKENLIVITGSLLGTFSILSGLWMSKVNHYILGLFLTVTAIALYFLQVFFAGKKNWLDIRAIFTGVWIFTIGLASLRLTNYQEQWQSKTWILISLAYLVFQLGATAGIDTGKKYCSSILEKISNIKIGKISFNLREERLFLICVSTTIIGLICFIINVIIRGYIPCFSDNPNAYLEFYTKLQIFSVAATGVSGLCFYCIINRPLKTYQKIILFLCIFYNAILYPILIVSRGTFLAAAVAITVVVFYLYGRKFWVLVSCLSIIFGVYVGCSYLRNYTDAQLSEFFEPSKIVIGNNEDDDKTDDDKEDVDKDNDSGSENNSQITFSLPPKLSWIYSYLTVSHDNFNEAVENIENLTYGTRQFAPINSVFRIDWVEQQNKNAENHFVRPHLNTINLIGDFFYDFGTIGVFIGLFVWSFIFGMNQGLCENKKNCFLLCLLGNTVVPVVFCFFASWTSVFSQWLLWGVVLLFMVAASIHIEPKTNNE